MNAITFNETIKTKVSNILAARHLDVDVNVEHLTKANGIEYDALTFTGKDMLQPVINLNQFFHSYQCHDADIDDIANDIADIYEESFLPDDDYKVIFNFEQVKNKIFPCLYNTAINSKISDQYIHREYLDLSVYYYVTLPIKNDGSGTILISRKLLDLWNISIEELDQTAFNNLHVNKHPQITSMYDLFKDENNEKDISYIDDLSRNMFILSCKSDTNGAIYMTDTGILDQLSSMTSSDLIILPSSRHELIVLPSYLMKSHAEINDFKSMVHEVNSTVLRPEDFLSDNVYCYSAEDHELNIA